MLFCNAILLIFLSAINAFSMSSVVHVHPGPMHPPSHGEIWPKPQLQLRFDDYYTFDPSEFTFNITDHTCDILTNATHRYVYTLRSLYDFALRFGLNNSDTVKGDHNKGRVKQLRIELSAKCEERPSLGMDEVYYLNVSSTSLLRSSSIWGILRGLESFAQLFYVTNDFKEIRVYNTAIFDYPRFAHRGLMIDTSRHFIYVENILKTLDAMAINKMNVLHWHIVDDQSFPYESETFPHLSSQGAYHSSLIYKKADVQQVIEYARNRGIRVIPEFDVPGHTQSWGLAYPNVLTQCYNIKHEPNGLGPMNPIKNVTYKLLRDLFLEVQEVFPDAYLHVGGDEVDLSCWLSNPDIKQFMKNNNLKTGSELHALFMKNVFPLLNNKSKPIVWQEVFDEGVPLTNDSLVQVWKDEGLELARVVKSGHKTLYSTSWYLDHLNDEFDQLYSVDPWQMVMDITKDPRLASMVIGGEACMWAEMVDDHNFNSRIWPRASAVAERLWSPGMGKTRYSWQLIKIPDFTYRRIEEHTCRMIRRGIPAQPPKGPGFCLT